MSTDLKQEIKFQLEQAANRAADDAVDDGYVVGTFPYEEARLDAMADECIRQMRWTGMQVAHGFLEAEWSNDDLADAYNDGGKYIDAAPPQWSPSNPCSIPR